MSLSGNPASLKAFGEKLRALPTVVAQKVAAEAAPILTQLALDTFNAGEDSYGGTWKILEDGRRATLDKSGSLKNHIRYVAIGTKLRVSLGVSYSKYVVGKRPVFPRQGQTLPVAYSDALSKVTAAICREELGQ